jgi:hypothetical protein
MLGRAVLVTLAAPDDDLVGCEVDVLDPEAAAFEDAKTSAVQQAHHDTRRPAEALDHGADLLAGEDNGQARRALGSHDLVEPGQLDVQNVPIEEQERAQRLVLRRRGDATLDREGTEKARHLRAAHLDGMPLAVKEDVAPDPRDVGFFCASCSGECAAPPARGRAAFVSEPRALASPERRAFVRRC